MCLWDVAQAAAEVSPVSVLRGHTGVVEDVDWSRQQPHLFGSVGDDRQLLIWDTRCFLVLVLIYLSTSP